MSRSPRTLSAALEKWFASSARDLPWRRSYDPYEVWVSEVMLQQTRMEVVVPYFERFIARFPSVERLAEAPLEDVIAAWSGLGYYRRAKMLHEGARAVAGRDFPSSIDALRDIPGVGRYTAGAICSIGFDGRAAIVDGNVARVVARLKAIDAPAASKRLMEAAWREAESLVTACDSPRNLNQALMELGALVCTPRIPSCGECPLQRHCQAFRTGGPERYPAPKLRRPTEELKIPLHFVVDEKGRVLFIREEARLMGGMFHLPHGSSALLVDRSALFTARDELGSFRHTITHRRITFIVHAATLRHDFVSNSASCEIQWLTPDDLDSLPHPSYVKKALRVAASNSRNNRSSTMPA